MLLRIFLILTILAGIGAIAITQFKVRPHIVGIIDERDRQTQRADRAERNLSDTRKTLAETEADLRDTKQTLDSTTAKLKSTEGDLSVARNTAEQLQKDLLETQAARRSAERELSAWAGLGIPVDAVKALIDDAKKLRTDIEALTEEKRIITDELNRALAEIDVYRKGRGEDAEVPLPAGIRGRVLVVDDKWKFVVLDVGRRDKIQENGVLLVSRDGRLVAKVQIKRVHDNRSIANVMPGWSFDEIYEGDVVLN